MEQQFSIPVKMIAVYVRSEEVPAIRVNEIIEWIKTSGGRKIDTNTFMFVNDAPTTTEFQEKFAPLCSGEGYVVFEGGAATPRLLVVANETPVKDIKISVVRTS